MRTFAEKIAQLKEDKYYLYKCIFALLAFCVALVNFARTMAPTTSFWDCGEFIACSYTLGVPHPPGTPMFILICRFFTLIEFFKEVAVQVNFVSALSSALAVLFMYLLIARSLEYWLKGEDTFTKGAIIIGGAFSGALAMTFSDTFWFNAVEAEVYNMAVFIMLLCSWLALVWMDNQEKKGSEKLLILIMYILFLTPAIHIQAMIVVPPILMLVLLISPEMRTNWKPYVIGIAMSMVVYAVTNFMFLVFTFSVVLFFKVILTRKTWSTGFSIFIALVLAFTGYKLFSFVPIGTFMGFVNIVFLIAFTVLLFVIPEKPRYNSTFWFWIVFVALIGYAPQAYIPIRSGMNPNIDENNPENWKNFQGFLERKQYGQDNMVESMFKRRTTWKEQFGTNPHCGFWGFFRQQYVRHNPANPWYWQWYMIPILIGLFGFYVQWQKDRTTALFFTVLFVLCSLGILVVFNFKQHEVRIRDYFYTPGFVMFSYWVGIGVAGLIYKLSVFIKHYQPEMRKIVIGVCTLILMVLPAVPVMATAHHNNEKDIYYIHDRSRNFIPWDYAYNILQTVAPNGIIFTNGDNDTFPLWFLQEVVKVRTDVRIVNLSLLNTPWYIKQLRNLEPKIPIRFTDNFIDTKLVPRRLPKGGIVKVGGIPVKVKKGQVFRVQDWMIIEIVNALNWTKPVFFAVTVSKSNKIGLDAYLKMEGLAFRLYPEKVDTKLDEERTRHNLYEVYQYRGLTDPLVYKNANTMKLISNYNAAYFQLALKYHNEQNRPEEAIGVLERADSLVGIGWRGYYLMSQVYTKMRKFDRAVEKLQLVLKEKPKEVGVHMNLGTLYNNLGKRKEAIQAFEKVLKIRPNVAQAYRMLERLYHQEKQYGKLIPLVSRWIKINPKDNRARQRLAIYQRQARAGAAARAVPDSATDSITPTVNQ